MCIYVYFTNNQCKQSQCNNHCNHCECKTVIITVIQNCECKTVITVNPNCECKSSNVKL